MILSALKYTRNAGEPREWSIIGHSEDYAYFGNMSLLVGKNASGKSRTLNIIREIANLLSAKINLQNTVSTSEHYDLIFAGDRFSYRYVLTFKDRQVIDEILFHNDKIILDRNNNFFLNKDCLLKLSSLKEDLLAVALLDQTGKPYFEDLVCWGKSLTNYLFANQLEKNRLVKDYTQISQGDEDLDDPDVLIYTFFKGRELFGETFISEIKSGMNELGYSITDIDIQKSGAGYGLSIQEEGKYLVSQREMSQGMYRALSLFIMLSYARLCDLSFCMLVDDMGEGLDFESSQKMIEIVIKKVNKSNMQFFMTSNDRHVMNQIPLKYWSVIGRNHNKSIFYDYKNSKEIFEDFKYTGLNNFDFLATDFFKEGFGIIDEDNN